MIPFHKVVIIGAGISGLTAAVYLQRSGFQTLVLEKAGGPGGVSTSWKRKGYTFEGGVHWLIGAKKEIPLHQVWKETGALQENNPVYFKDPIYTLVDSEGTMPLFRDLHGLETKGLRDRIALWSLRFHLACFKHFHQPIGDLRGLKVRHPKPFSIGEYAKMLPAVLLTPFLMAQSARGYAKRFKNKRIRSLLAAVVEPDINALSLIYTLGTFEGSYMTDWPPFSRLYHAPVRYRKGLYFTGQRTAYSGGLPPAAQSGRTTAQAVCKDFGVEFVGTQFSRSHRLQNMAI